MSFHIGQKVVCIEAATGTCAHREPDLNDICTITNIYMHSVGLVLELKEFPALKCAHFEAGWLAESFRPLVERKTSIEIFTRMLTDQQISADA